MPEIPWWDLLTKNNHDLKVDNPSRCRLDRLRQPLPISTVWARMVGLWGGQKTAAEVSDIVEKPTRAVRSYAQARKLRLATRNFPPRPQAAVALECYQIYQEKKSLEATAEQVGVLPVEALYYRRGIDSLCKLIGDTPDDLTEYTDEQLQGLWLHAGLRLYYPRTVDEQAAFPAEAAALLSHPIQ